MDKNELPPRRLFVDRAAAGAVTAADNNITAPLRVTKSVTLAVNAPSPNGVASPNASPNSRQARYRAAHKAEHRAYMRAYMQKRRSTHADGV